MKTINILISLVAVLLGGILFYLVRINQQIADMPKLKTFTRGELTEIHQEKNKEKKDSLLRTQSVFRVDGFVSADVGTVDVNVTNPEDFR